MYTHKLLFLLLIFSCRFLYAQGHNDSLSKHSDPSDAYSSSVSIPTKENKHLTAQITKPTSNTSFVMKAEDSSIVEKYISTYSYKTIKNALERSGVYKDIILKIFRDFNLPEELFYLPVIESYYDLNDVSGAGAVGLWQIMAQTGSSLGLKINCWIDERKDPEKSTKAACLYLKRLYAMFNNDWDLALVAYNRGECKLARDMKFSNASTISELVSRNVIPKETKDCFYRFKAVVTIGNNLEKYGFGDLKYAKPLNYDKYTTNKIIDLKIVAQCAETTIEEIRRLNPGLKTWCTPHGYPNFELKIPYGSKEKFKKNIALVKDLNPSSRFVKHKVARGEYIEEIAAKYKVTPKEIYKDSPTLTKQKRLKPGQVIVIRPNRKYFNQ